MMSKPDIGVDIDDFGLPTKQALRKASGMEFRSVECSAASGDISPEALSGSGRRHLMRFVDGLGLRAVSLVAEFPGLKLTDRETVDECVARTVAVLELAADMGVPVVTAGVGTLMSDDEASGTLREALHRIGEFADVRGVRFALRNLQHDGEVVSSLLDALDCPAIQVCLDPASMVMHGVNPLGSIERYIDRIGLFHARDGRLGTPEQAGRETPLGEGDVDLIGVLAALDAGGYHASHIIRRSDSATAESDILRARDYLAKCLSAR